MFQIARIGIYILIFFMTYSYWNHYCFELSDFFVSILSIEAVLISYSQNKHNRDQMEIKLFLDFNEKYNRLNDRLECISKNAINTNETAILNQSDKAIIVDYINLCCEQYYCYRVKKLIPNHVWKFWHSGIMYWCINIPQLLEIWESEFNQSNSFYIKNNDHPFKQEARK